MKKWLSTCTAILVLAASAASAQSIEAVAPYGDGAVERRLVTPRFDDVRARAQSDDDRAIARPASRPDDEEKNRWDAIKRGFFAGLIVGGVVGVVMAADCGHPECGPLIPFAAGIGGAIGLGIDALVDCRHAVADPPSHRGAGAPVASAGRLVMLRFRKSW